MPALGRLKDRFRVVSVFNRTEAKAARFASDFRVPEVASSLSSLLKNPEIDAVLLALPIPLNPKVGMEVLRAGKPCFCEKPLAPTLSAGTAFLKKAARFSTPFLVTENYVFNPLWVKFIDLVENGAIGKPLYFYLRIFSHMDVRNPYAQTVWRKKPEHLGGFLGDAGVHYAAVMRRAFGEPRAIQSRVLSLRREVPPVDTLFCQMDYDSGLTGQVAYSFSVDAKEGQVWEVSGDRGSLCLTNDHLALRRAGHEKTVLYEKKNSFEMMYRHYYEVLTRGIRSRYSLMDAWLDLRLIHRMLTPEGR